jgi:hypothetical protein
MTAQNNYIIQCMGKCKTIHGTPTVVEIIDTSFTYFKITYFILSTLLLNVICC